MITATLLPLVETDASVRPGWIPLLIVLALGAFIAFLYFSMKKQLGKIDFTEDPGDETENGDSPTPSAQA